MHVFIHATELTDDDDVADDAHQFFELGPSDYDSDNADLHDGSDADSHDGGDTDSHGGDDADLHDGTSDNINNLPSHVLDMYDQTFGDGRNGSTDSDAGNAAGGDSIVQYDSYAVDGGDSLAAYDDTFYTAADRPTTPHPTLRNLGLRFKALENQHAIHLGNAIPYPEVLGPCPAAVASRTLTKEVFDTEETDPADGYYWGQAAISGPKLYNEAMVSPQSAKWKEAVAAELESIDSNDVMEI
ncbi:hypothetical protein IWW56_006287, partial [Coemansia sp. RSA 2131]